MIATVTVDTDANLITVCAFTDTPPCTLQTRLYFDKTTGRHILPAHICRALDVLFGQKAILCWRNEQEMQLFVDAAKRHLNYRVKQHSIILPQLVDATAQAELRITPEMLNEALRVAGKTTGKNVGSYIS